MLSGSYLDMLHYITAGADRGPVLEVIVSRMRYVAARSESSVRFIGLSTALANAGDLGGWLGVGPRGLFNFKPSVRPVPLECHIQVGFTHSLRECVTLRTKCLVGWLGGWVGICCYFLFFSFSKNEG